MAEEPETLSGTKATEEDSSWHEYLRSTEQQEPERLEAAAKFLSGMISISLTIFLSTDKELLKEASFSLLTLLVGLWLAALLGCFMVFYPMPYGANKDSAESIKSMHKKIVKKKLVRLAASAICFLLALGILVVIYMKSLMAA